MKMESGALQSSSASFGFGGFQAPFPTFPPLFYFLCIWNWAWLVSGRKTRKRMAEDLKWMKNHNHMDIQWWQRMTKVLDDSCGTNRVHAVLKNLFPAAWICFHSIFESGSGGGGDKEQPNRLKKKSSYSLLYAASRTHSSGKSSCYKEEKCFSLLGNKLDWQFISIYFQHPRHLM